MPIDEDLCPVILFSGKGGVGKTTLAAATAVRLAASGGRVLLVSTDPAHSLSDVFDQRLGAQPIEVTPGLQAMEVDARGMFSAALDQTEDGDGAVARMMKMATQTPGVDEFGAIEVLLRAVENAAHDVVILDTAPTGHTLRLLMLPELLDGWLGTLLSLRDQIARAGRLLRRLLPKGASADASAELQQGLADGRQRMAALRQLLTDPERAQIMLVTIPEAMSVLETLRTLTLLSRQGLPVGTVIVNQLQPSSPSCQHCERRREIHLAELGGLRRRVGAIPVRVVESVPREIRGCEALAALGERVWGDQCLVP